MEPRQLALKQRRQPQLARQRKRNQPQSRPQQLSHQELQASLLASTGLTSLLSLINTFHKVSIPSKAGLWKDLPYIAHPFIFEKVKNGQSSSFKLHLNLKPTCNPDTAGNPLPSYTVDDSLQNGEVVYDCDENHGHHFSRDTNSYFEDECSNPILFYNTIWTPSKQRIRVVKLSESRVACCINYPLQNVPLSRKQALACNNAEDVSFKCKNKTDISVLLVRVTAVTRRTVVLETN
ncbi:unnamed protein product [Orchesella dallaii]|uniref:Uncharacterized protein n=1 Tax=Orchesella dallaii TaxID=48710 RepID=A0ABP1R6A5_9HEXA